MKKTDSHKKPPHKASSKGKGFQFHPGAEPAQPKPDLNDPIKGLKNALKAMKAQALAQQVAGILPQ